MRYKQDARKQLAARTEVSEDRKSGVISLTVTDSDPQRAHDIAQSYVEALDRLVSQVSTSSARRERMFIEQRLISVKADLEDAEKQFSAFASQNTALDIKEQTRAMVESAAVLQGQVMAAQSELPGTDLHREQCPGSCPASANGRTQTATDTTGRIRFVAGCGCDVRQFQRPLSLDSKVAFTGSSVGRSLPPDESTGDGL
jgi:hypothetical protein